MEVWNGMQVDCHLRRGYSFQAFLHLVYGIYILSKENWSELAVGDW